MHTGLKRSSALPLQRAFIVRRLIFQWMDTMEVGSREGILRAYRQQRVVILRL